MQSRNKAPAPIDVFPPAPERVVFDSGAVSDDVDEQSVSPSLSRSRTTSADLGFHGERDDALYGVLSSDSENSNWARDFQVRTTCLPCLFFVGFICRLLLTMSCYRQGVAKFRRLSEISYNFGGHMGDFRRDLLV